MPQSGTSPRLFAGSFLLALLLCLHSQSACAQLIPPRQVGLSRIDPHTGKILWTARFPEGADPYRYEAYSSRIVVFSYTRNRNDDIEDFGPTHTSAFFFDSRTGAKVPPFDTQVWDSTDRDPQLGASGYRDYGPTGDPRSRIELPNGWKSDGIMKSDEQQVGFLDFYDDYGAFKWRLAFETGDHERIGPILTWSNIIIFQRTVRDGGTILVSHLFGQLAGQSEPAWEFVLPEDVPTADMNGGDVLCEKCMRSFSCALSRTNIFIYGSGTLFSIDPATGKTIWRHTVSADAVILQSKDPSLLINAEIIDAGDAILLDSWRWLIRFDKQSRKTTAILRSDLSFDPSPLYVQDSLFCFRVLKGPQP
jgi:hypothetical protein